VFIWGYDQRELLLYSYLGAVALSVGLALYGSLIFLFSWMPHRWVTYGEEGDPIWKAALLSGMGAFFGTGALLDGLIKAQAKISELDRWKLHAEKKRAFEELIKHELAEIGSMLRYSALERDVFVRLERKIDEAEKVHKIYPGDAEVCRDLLATFRTARGNA
jgi:hypothetical protein